MSRPQSKTAATGNFTHTEPSFTLIRVQTPSAQHAAPFLSEMLRVLARTAAKADGENVVLQNQSFHPSVSWFRYQTRPTSSQVVKPGRQEVEEQPDLGGCVHASPEMVGGHQLSPSASCWTKHKHTWDMCPHVSHAGSYIHKFLQI